SHPCSRTRTSQRIARPGASYCARLRAIAVLRAVQHVRRMRGGAQAHLMRADDEQYYVVKFQNNPQHIRVLANELLVSRVAERVGLPVPHGVVIEVTQWLIDNTADLHMQLAGEKV